MTPVISGPISSEYMLMNLKSFFSLMAAGAVALASIAAPESTGNNIIEEVAWMVGDQPIYKSEIEEAYQQMLYEKTPVNGDPYCVIPEQLAIEKLFLHQADIDTVEVQESMVSLAVDQRVNYMITNLGSKEKVEEYFRKPMSEFRSGLADMMRNQYRIQEVQRSLTKNLKVTPSDVQRYFAGLPQDSIPYIPLQVEVEIITINPKIPQEEIDDVKSRLRQYTDRINKGESEFSTLAILYSEDPGSSVRGGEIGFMGRGHLEPEYAAVAFNLNDTKKVSKIVETVHRLDSVRANIVTHKRFTFEEAAPIISQDKDTRNNQGRMVNSASGTTRFEMKDLPQEVAKVVDRMQVGDVSEAFIMKDPKRDRDIVAIVKLTERIPAHKATLSEDYQTIKGMYENSEKQKMVKKWLSKKIRDTYVKIEDNWSDCEFEHPEWLKK